MLSSAAPLDQLQCNQRLSKYGVMCFVCDTRILVQRVCVCSISIVVVSIVHKNGKQLFPTTTLRDHAPLLAAFPVMKQWMHYSSPLFAHVLFFSHCWIAINPFLVLVLRPNKAFRQIRRGILQSFVKSECTHVVTDSAVMHSPYLVFEQLTVAYGRVMAKRLRCYFGCDTKPIRLNVGGRIFDISLETANSFQYLQARLGDNFHSPLDELGEVFVDRCPQLFQVILQSVRTLTRPRQHHILERKCELLAECEFARSRVATRTVR